MVNGTETRTIGARRGISRANPADWRADMELRLLRLYYWATPLFFIADAVWGVSVRASFLPSAEARWLYYGFCVGCAVACHRWPASSPWVGMGESAVSVTLLALGVMLPIWGMTDAVLEGGAVPVLLTPGRLVNVVLSGTILVIAFHRNRLRVESSLRLGPGRPAFMVRPAQGGRWRGRGGRDG